MSTKKPAAKKAAKKPAKKAAKKPVKKTAKSAKKVNNKLPVKKIPVKKVAPKKAAPKVVAIKAVTDSTGVVTMKSVDDPGVATTGKAASLKPKLDVDTGVLTMVTEDDSEDNFAF